MSQGQQFYERGCICPETPCPYHPLNADTLSVIPVVAAVRYREGRYWACRRNGKGAHGGLAGMWEYPGGKVEEGETAEAALRRELFEEFGVHATIGTLRDTIVTETQGKFYRVMFFDVLFDTDEVTLSVHDAVGWFTISELLVQPHLPSGTEFNRRLAEGERRRAAHP